MKIAKKAILGALVVGGLFAVTSPASADYRHGHYYNYRADVRNDRRELFNDRRELRRDLRNGASRAEIANDRREIRGDVRDLRQNHGGWRYDRWGHRTWWGW
jgi:hypothetical protein